MGSRSVPRAQPGDVLVTPWARYRVEEVVRMTLPGQGTQWCYLSGGIWFTDRQVLNWRLEQAGVVEPRPATVVKAP